MEFAADYTPTINYITDTTKFSLKYNEQTLISESAYNYERLFFFVNYDLSPLSTTLNEFYEYSPECPKNIKPYFDRISEYLSVLFSVSSFLITMNFIIYDYTEHIKRIYLQSRTTEEKDTLKQKYLHFLECVYDCHSLYPEDHSMTELSVENIAYFFPKDTTGTVFYQKELFSKYCEDLFAEKISSVCQLHKTEISLPSISAPPYNGSVVKTKIYDFYNELIWLISYKAYGENSGTLPRPIYAKLHTASTSPDSSIQPVF